MLSKKPFILFTKYSPYYIVDLPLMQYADGRLVPLAPVTALCRCGASKNKPYCDSSHVKVGFVGEKDPDRTPDRTKEYRGEKISILDNRGVCNHNGACVRRMPQVFSVSKRPWINPDGDTPDAIKFINALCPSGSLSYKLKSKRVQDVKRPPALILNPGGPIDIQGGVPIKDDLGTTPECKEHYSLCRCGKSKNPPFCDGHHYYSFFDEVSLKEKGDPITTSAPKD